jgi:hypothetical protein
VRARARFAVVAIAAVGLCCGAALAAGALREGTPPSDTLKATWAPDGTVHALVQVGSTIYIGGDFDRLTPVSGHAMAYDASTGATMAPWPVIDGDVLASVADGRGGFFLGGAFTNADGKAHRDLVHVEADGSVDPGFDPLVNGSVNALAVAGGRL